MEIKRHADRSMRPVRLRYKIVREAGGEWAFWQGPRLRCEWGAAWSADAILAIVTELVYLETLQRVRWRERASAGTTPRTVYLSWRVSCLDGSGGRPGGSRPPTPATGRRRPRF